MGLGGKSAARYFTARGMTANLSSNQMREMKLAKLLQALEKAERSGRCPPGKGACAATSSHTFKAHPTCWAAICLLSAVSLLLPTAFVAVLGT